MHKLWQVAPKIRDSFIKDNPDIDPVVLQLLHNRGIKQRQDIDFFINGNFEDFNDPFLFKSMDKAVDLIIKKIKAKEKICIYGDYDADGITSSALLYELLSVFKADCFVYIPDRIKEGYGMSIEGLKKVVKKDPGLIITVDNGIRNKEEVEFSKNKGVDVIVTDHHPAPDKKSDMPDCLVIDPHVKGETYPDKYLAGVGVAFKLAQALIEKAKLSQEHKRGLARRQLDLVAIGTIADCMALLGENHILVKEGLKVINRKRRPGLRELIRVAGIDKRELKAWNIGFQIAPRLNASSRMDSAVAAFDLLVSQDEREAREKAADLDKKNISRQKLTEEAVYQVEEQMESQYDDKVILGVAPDDHPWSEGIVGLVAGRITEKYYKPCIVITKGSGEWKGSGRSIDEFNLAKALEECKGLLLKNGGHAKACGLSIEKHNIKEFSRMIKSLAGKELKGVELAPKVRIDLEIDISRINKGFINDIYSLSPFGQKNPEPKFLSKGVQIRDIVNIGSDGRHIKMRLNKLWALAFGQADKLSDHKIGDRVDVVYTVDINEFNGRSEAQAKIIDIKSNY